MDGMLSQHYHRMVAESDNVFLELPYSRWSTFSNSASPSGSTTFNVSSQSLDMLIAQFSPIVSAAAQFTDGVGGGLNTSYALGSSTYFLRPSSFSNANVTFDVTDWQFYIGGINVPGWNITNELTYTQTMDALKANRDLLGGVTSTLAPAVAHTLSLNAPQYTVTPLTAAYLSAYTCFMIRLNNDEEKGWISGTDMKGNSLNCQFIWTGTGTNVNGSTLMNYVFAKNTASLIIKAGREADYIA